MSSESSIRTHRLTAEVHAKTKKATPAVVSFSEQQSLWCTFCNRKGHLEKDCFKLTKATPIPSTTQATPRQIPVPRARERTTEPRIQPTPTKIAALPQVSVQDRTSKQVKCFRCNQFGHVKRDCPQPQQPPARKVAATKRFEADE